MPTHNRLLQDPLVTYARSDHGMASSEEEEEGRGDLRGLGGALEVDSLGGEDAPLHAFNQQKLFADVLAARIHVQNIVTRLDGPAPGLVGGLRTLVTMLLRVRNEALAQGIFAHLSPASTEPLWEALHGTDELLWSEHTRILAEWERREQLASKRPLKALSRGVMDQVQAVLQRRAELKVAPGFANEDGAFYDALLKDFITSMDQRAPKRRRKVKRADVNVKASKGRQIRYEVHDKLVNFVPPQPGPDYTVDVDNLCKSLFA